jgi:prepilin-type processing-associated H-X9-DG protein
MYVWPYIEQTVLANQLNTSTQQFYLPPATNGGSLTGLTGAKVPLYYCPSDFGADLDAAGAFYQRRRGNYVVNWGETRYDTLPNQARLAPFYHNGPAGNPRSSSGIVKLTSITDGTSNTLMMSETLMSNSHNDDDWRGDIQNDDGVFKFMTITTPNSSTPDVVNWINPNPDTNPVTPALSAGSQFSAARSRHSGGVNVALCDGSIRFVSNSIPLATWQTLGTMNAGDIVPNY